LIRAIVVHTMLRARRTEETRIASARVIGVTVRPNTSFHTTDCRCDGGAQGDTIAAATSVGATGAAETCPMPGRSDAITPTGRHAATPIGRLPETHRVS
jgi:hypothetical protein